MYLPTYQQMHTLVFYPVRFSFAFQQTQTPEKTTLRRSIRSMTAQRKSPIASAVAGSPGFIEPLRKSGGISFRCGSRPTQSGCPKARMRSIKSSAKCRGARAAAACVAPVPALPEAGLAEAFESDGDDALNEASSWFEPVLVRVRSSHRCLRSSNPAAPILPYETPFAP